MVFPFLIYCKIEWCSSTYRSNLNRLLYIIYRNASSESFVEQNILPILHPYFGLLISLIFLTSTRSLLLVLCTRITIIFFVILLTPPLLLIVKYTHIILEMLITTDHISEEPTLNSSQSFTWDLNYRTLFPIIFRSWQGTGSRFKTSLKKYISYRESYKLNLPDHDMVAYTKSELNMRSPYFYKLYTSTCGLPRHFICYKS